MNLNLVQFCHILLPTAGGIYQGIHTVRNTAFVASVITSYETVKKSLPHINYLDETYRTVKVPRALG